MPAFAGMTIERPMAPPGVKHSRWAEDRHAADLKAEKVLKGLDDALRKASEALQEYSKEHMRALGFKP
jgi:hypothetical protein